MAKIYEKPADKEKERIITEIFCKHMNFQYSLPPARARYDFHIIQKANYGGQILDVIVGLAEVKVRTCSIDAYPTYMLDADKKNWMLDFANEQRIPYLVVAWTDAIGWIDLRHKSFLSTGGRTDRNDINDFKLMVHYPIKAFNLLVDKR